MMRNMVVWVGKHFEEKRKIDAYEMNCFVLRLWGFRV